MEKGHMRREDPLALSPLQAEAVRLRAEGLTQAQTAAKMGRTLKSIEWLLKKAHQKRKLHAEDAVIDTTPGCTVCGLRGEHVCISTRAVDYLRQAQAPCDE